MIGSAPLFSLVGTTHLTAAGMALWLWTSSGLTTCPDIRRQEYQSECFHFMTLNFAEVTAKWQELTSLQLKQKYGFVSQSFREIKRNKIISVDSWYLLESEIIHYTLAGNLFRGEGSVIVLKVKLPCLYQKSRFSDKLIPKCGPLPYRGGCSLKE